MRPSYRSRLRRDFTQNRAIYFMVIPIVLFYILFHYKTMYGTIIAFFNYRPAKGLKGSKFVGLDHFIYFFTSPFFWRTLRNTLAISVLSILFGFTAPIILALLLNEAKNTYFKKFIQTITYLPHFISTVIICGMLSSFCLTTGLFNDIIAFFGGDRISLLQGTKYYRTVYIASDIWQTVGWSSIIYLAALAGVDKTLYEVAQLDGANKWQQILHVTIPCLVPTIVIMFILKVGKMFDVGYEKIMLLYTPLTYERADVINTYVYRRGFAENVNFSYSTAVGFFNSVVCLILVFFTNKITRRLGGNSLW